MFTKYQLEAIKIDVSHVLEYVELPNELKVVREQILEAIKLAGTGGEKASDNTESLQSAIDIVERLAKWCNRYPESSINPMGGLKEFHEIEKSANNFVDSRQ